MSEGEKKNAPEPTWGQLLQELCSKALATLFLGFFLALGMVCAFWVFGTIVHAAEITIPRAAEQHKGTLTRAARAYWGLDAPVAVFAAQVHTESWWRNDTVSHVGAQGLAQFMPATARWLPSVMPETGKPAPFNPAWSLRALCAYDRWLWERTGAWSDYERMAFTLSAYNGGHGWVLRDKAKARKLGKDDRRWFGHVENVNAGRSRAAFAENRQYPRRILQERQQVYARAGWGPGLTPEEP